MLVRGYDYVMVPGTQYLKGVGLFCFNWPCQFLVINYLLVQQNGSEIFDFRIADIIPFCKFFGVQYF